MPLFYFDIIIDDQRATDVFGLDLSGIDEACDQAAALLPDIARDELPSGQCRNFSCEVRDWLMRRVYVCTLSFWDENLP